MRYRWIDDDERTGIEQVTSGLQIRSTGSSPCVAEGRAPTGVPGPKKQVGQRWPLSVSVI